MESNTDQPVDKKKIYCFVNGGNGVDWFNMLALCEDGHCLAQHISSNIWFGKHDIGITSDCKHENYKKHCPEGYELIWVDDATDSPEISAAYAKNQELAAKAVIVHDWHPGQSAKCRQNKTRP